jgi:cytochrome b involved in lipid metabolism
MDIIKEHTEEASCWTTVNGIVYDLTAFINKHPGGDKNILKIC